MDRNKGDYYNSSEPLKTSRAHHHQIGVTIHDSFISKLDDRRYVDMSTNTIDTWSIAGGRRVRVENWQSAVIHETEQVITDLDRVIEELIFHRLRLRQEIIELSTEEEE